MKLAIRKLLIQILQPLGFYITYYASAQKVYESLKKQPTLIQAFELKRIFDSVRIAKNHSYYNQLLASFIPNWNLEIKEPKFIGFGAGESSLSTFRKVKVNAKYLHEKIYFSFHPDSQRISWLYDSLSELINRFDIVTPDLNAVYKGATITAFYTDFLELKPLEVNSKEQKLLQFSKQLYQLSITSEFEKTVEKTPQSFTDFTQHFEYKRNRLQAQQILTIHNIDLSSLEQTIRKSRYILTHGDIQETNAFENKVLIDWDSVGIFPIGLDPAFSLFYLLMNDKNEKFDILKWIEENFKNIVAQEDWENFQKNIVCFLFVFIQDRIKGEKYDRMNNELIDLLNSFDNK